MVLFSFCLVFSVFFTNTTLFFFKKIKNTFIFFNETKLVIFLLFFQTLMSSVFFANINFLFLLILLSTPVFFLKKSVTFAYVYTNLFLIFTILLNSSDVLFFFLLTEFLGFFIFLFLFFQKKTSLFANPKAIYSFINLNILSVFFFILFFSCMYTSSNTTKIYDYSKLTQTNFYLIKSTLTAFFLIKLGYLTGPSFLIKIYGNLNGVFIPTYVLSYLIVLPYIFINFFGGLINQPALIKASVFLILFNFLFIKKAYSVRFFFYTSSQANLIYLSLFINLMIF